MQIDYVGSLMGLPRISMDEILELLPAAQSGDGEALERIVRGCLHICVHEARRLQSGSNFEDLINEGVAGLTRGILNVRFDAAKGLRGIRSYCHLCARRAMIDSLRAFNPNHAINRRTSSTFRKSVAAFRKSIAAGHTFEDAVTHASIETNTTRDQIWLHCLKASTSDAPLEDHETALSDATLTPADAVWMKERHALLMMLIEAAELTPGEFEVFRLRCSPDEPTYKQIGDAVGVSSSRAHQILTSAIAKVRKVSVHFRDEF